MSGRYRHFIAQANEGHWPTAIVCVDCTSTAEPTTGRGVQCRERLERLAVVGLQRHDGGYRHSHSGSGSDGPTFLATLGELAKREPNLWVVSYQCNRVWSLLGVWEAIEDERITICGTDHRNSAARRERIRAYRLGLDDPLRTLCGAEARRVHQGDAGYLVVEDPPCILHGRVHDSNHHCTWVDIRNYGCEAPPELQPGSGTTYWLAETITAIARLCGHNRLTALKATAGSQAMSAWRHAYYDGRVYVHTDHGATGIEGRAYFGGRCEASRIGLVQRPIYHVDFRSQYGWVCVDSRLPARLRDHRTGDGGRSAAARPDPSASIVDVTVDTEEPAYPVRHDGEVIWPVGRFRTSLCGPEYADALQHGRVRRVHAYATYDTDYCLRDYAERLYGMRIQAEGTESQAVGQWIKRMIVSLPGKLGQMSHRWVDAPEVVPQCMYGEWMEETNHGELSRYRSVAGVVQRDNVDGFAADSVPAIAGWITSAARIRLLNAIRAAAWPNVYYWDTDSLMVNQEGYDRLRQSEFMSSIGMGYLTLRSQPDVLEIRGVKYYVEDGRVTCAGLPKGHTVDVGDGVHYTRYLSATEQARKGHRPEAVVVTEKYARVEAYNQGVVGPDGTVTPIRLSE